nr:citrate-binding protein-like [Populus alba]
MERSYSLLLLFLALFSLKSFNLLCSAADPTDGFTPVPLTEANFVLQKPYNVPLNERCSYEDGVRSLWVYATDKPQDPSSNTQPRTEVRITVTPLPLSFSLRVLTVRQEYGNLKAMVLCQMEHQV